MWVNINVSKMIETDKAVFVVLTNYESEYKADVGIWVSKKCYRYHDYYGSSVGINEDWEYTLIPIMEDDYNARLMAMGRNPKYELINKEHAGFEHLGGCVLKGSELLSKEYIRKIEYNKKQA